MTALAALLILSAPSLISHSSLGRTLLRQAAARRGIDATATSVRVGWMTPLRVTGLQLRGESGKTELTIERLDADLTATELIGSPPSDWGDIVFRGVDLNCAMDEAQCSVEADFASLWEGAGEGSGSTAAVKLQDITVTVTDEVAGGQWQIAQSSAEVTLAADQSEVVFAGVVSVPGGSGGSLQGKIERGNARWLVELESESMPLSVLTLVRRRLPGMAASIPPQIGGDATGALRLTGDDRGGIEAFLHQIEVRNLTAGDGHSPLWANRLATLDGDLLLTDTRVIGRGLKAQTDFATATIDGAFSRTVSISGDANHPLRWLEELDGAATAEIDLALLDHAMPGLLPLRQGTELVSGRAVAQLHTLPATGDDRRAELLIHSDELRARAQGRGVIIDPIEIKATVSSQQGQLRADQFSWTSAFANAVGHGDLRSGSATFRFDFGRLSSLLRPLVVIPDGSLEGAVQGNVGWNANQDGVWKLTGSGNATNVVIATPGGKTLQRQSLKGDVEAVGRWGGSSLQELNAANISLTSNGLTLRADLLDPVSQPDFASQLPLQFEGTGRLEELVATIGPWLPEPLHDAEGGFVLHARGKASAIAGDLQTATIDLNSPRMIYADRGFHQPNIKVFFDGSYRWPESHFRADSMTVAGDAFSAAIRGSAQRNDVDLLVKWRAKLERIQGSVQGKLAAARSVQPEVRQVGFRHSSGVEEEDWLLRGDCEGELKIVCDESQWRFESQITGKELAVVQPRTAGAAFQTVGPMPATSVRQAGQGSAARVVWSEPNLHVGGKLTMDRHTGRVETEALSLAGDWFATELRGDLAWGEPATVAGTSAAVDPATTPAQLNLIGPAKLKMTEVAKIVSQLTGADIVAEGIQQTPLTVRAERDHDGTISFVVGGNLGWESCRVAGVTLGAASVPVQLTETSLLVAPAVIPVGSGQINLAGDVNYRPGPLWFRVQPGPIARSIRLTPEMTNRWLKYLAPLVADATEIDGVFSAELDEAIVVTEQPELSRVVGRLNIEGVRMNAGPLANQIIGGVDQLRAIASATGMAAAAAAPRRPRTLISMPAQTVDFVVESGVVSHKTLFFEVDRAQVVTSGRVTLDGRLDLNAQVPLDARWLGSDLQGLAGQPVILPIDGTLSRPSLDSRGVRQVVSQLGTQAVQSTAENYLQQQFNRGIDKLFGR